MGRYEEERKDAGVAEPPTEVGEDRRERFDRLWRAAREEFLRSGEPMLDWDGLEREIAERRGGVSEED